jgi:hypothetical protein
MYTEEQLSMSLVQIGAGAADDLSATGVHTYSFAIMEQCCVRRLYALVSTLVDSAVTEAVVDFKFRPNFGSAAGEVTLGQLTIPDATVVGDVVYKDVSPYTLLAGGELVFEVSVAADTAGEAVYGVRADLDPEEAVNQSQLIASA